MFRLLLIISVSLAVIIGLSKLTNREEAVADAFEGAAEAVGNAADAASDMMDRADDGGEADVADDATMQTEGAQTEEPALSESDESVAADDLINEAAEALESASDSVEAVVEGTAVSAAEATSEAVATGAETVEEAGEAIEAATADAAGEEDTADSSEGDSEE